MGPMHQVTGGSYDEIIDNFQIYADLLVEHKVVGFQDPLYLTDVQQARVMLLLFDFDLCKNIYAHKGTSVWKNNTYGHLASDEEEDLETGTRTPPVNNPSDGVLRGGRLKPTDTIASNWHADCVEDRRPISYISMSMMEYNCPEGQGDTVFVNLEDLYEKCPFKGWLENQTFAHPVRLGIDLNRDAEPQIHPALRTHPITGETGLCVSDSRMLPMGAPKDAYGSGWLAAGRHRGYGYMGSDQQPEFQEYMDWLFDEINDPENQQWFRWEEGNFLIWDNRCHLHSFSGWDGSRNFNRALAGMDAVWYGKKPLIDIEEEANVPEALEDQQIYIQDMHSPKDLAESRTRPGGGYEVD